MEKQQKNNIPVKDWINQYKEQFERYNSYCDTNNWIYAEDVEEEYGVQKDISLIVLDRLKYFVKKFEPYLEFKYVKNFIDLMQIPVSLFLDRCNFYFENNDWLKIDNKEKQIEEMKFQSYMMSDFNKLKDKLQEINLDEEFISLDLPIFGDKLIPFLMQDMMENKYPEIKKFKEIYANNDLLDESGIPSLTPYDVLNSTEMFLNIKNPPIYDSSKHYFEQSQDVLDFYTEEYKKITQGITIAGVFIHPLLYWYLNFFKTDIPMSQFKNTPLYNPSKKRLITNPFLRDNELFYVDSYAEADEKNVGLFAFGTRRWGKTVMESAILSWSCTTVENSEALVIGGDEGDLQKLSKTLEIAFTNVHSAFYLPKNNNDWSKLIQFGLKNKAGERIPYGDIFIRNVNKGQEGSSEKTAGATPTAWIVDEAGKFNCKSMFQAAIPSFQTPDGWSLVPILSGCLTAGNKVFTKDGNLINIEDLKYENGIVGFNNETQEVSFEDITNINPPQSKECYKITTNKGTEIECSFDHPFLIKNRDKLETYINKDGIKDRRRKLDFIEADKLLVGTQLCLPDIIPLKGTRKMVEPYFIGAIIGDGNYSSDRGIRFSNEDKEIWDYFDSIDKDYRIDKEYVTEKGRIYKEVGFRGGMKYLKELGIYGQKGISKDLPIDIHLYQQNDICELLAGLYDTDGSIIKNNSNDKNFTIQLTSSSELLINSVKLLLVRLGIHSNKIFVKPDSRERVIKSKNGYFNLLISDRKSILQFYNLIPLKIKRKKDRLLDIVNILKNRTNKLDKHYPNLRFEKIIRIEYVGNKPVYNLTTSTTHTYLANGVITHNTGGNVDLSIDAQNMLMNPEENSILPMNWDRLDNMVQDKDLITWKRKNFGLFLPSQMSFKDGLKKVDKSLGDYFNIEDERLQKINIKVTDWVNSNKVIKEDRDKKKKDKTGLNKEKMYYPIDPNDCFLNKIENPFPALEAQLHKEYLIENGLIGRNVDIYRKQGTKLGWEFSDKDLPSFPFEGGNIDSPVILFEDPPEDNDIDGTYVSGLDHYKHNKASTNSLGANYIFKRNVNLDEWSDRVVACYYARPETIEKFNSINEMLIEGYGAECLQENADISFEQHLKAKHKLNLLANGEELARRLINPRASQNNKYGLNPNEKNQQYILNLVIDYCQEDIEIGEDEHGEKIIVKGVTKIPDIGLLDEIINFHYGGNFDKIVAFGHALAWARYLDSLNIMPKVKKKYTNDSTYKKQMRQDKLRAKSPYSYGNYKLYKK